MDTVFGHRVGKPARIAGFDLWALNSAVECHLHTVEVIGSNPIAPTTPECQGKCVLLWKF